MSTLGKQPCQVRVRRFENGSIENVALKSLERAGIKVERAMQKHRSGAAAEPTIGLFKVGRKTLDVKDLIQFANEVRIKRGEEPLFMPRGKGSAA